MEFLRFPLGLRFAMTKDAGLTPEQAWELVFSHVCGDGLSELTLYGMWDSTVGIEPEPAYICVFSNASIRRAKRLFQALKEDEVLCSYLTAYMPFVQNNWLEQCADVEYLGVIGEDGTVTGGDVAYGAMGFSGTAQDSGAKKTAKHPRILIAAETINGAYPAADATRRITRAALSVCPTAHLIPMRMCDGGDGTVDALVAAENGRYLFCQDTGVRYGVLPDRTVVIETEPLTDEQVEKVLANILRDGFQTFILAAGKRKLSVSFPPEATITILQNPVPTVPYVNNAQVTYASGVETALSHSGFLRECESADMVLIVTIARDESCDLLDVAADSIRYHCQCKNVPFSILAWLEDGGYMIRPYQMEAEKVPATNIDEAARELFSRIFK